MANVTTYFCGAFALILSNFGEIVIIGSFVALVKYLGICGSKWNVFQKLMGSIESKEKFVPYVK